MYYIVYNRINEVNSLGAKCDLAIQEHDIKPDNAIGELTEYNIRIYANTKFSIFADRDIDIVLYDTGMTVFISSVATIKHIKVGNNCLPYSHLNNLQKCMSCIFAIYRSAVKNKDKLYIDAPIACNIRKRNYDDLFHEPCERVFNLLSYASKGKEYSYNGIMNGINVKYRNVTDGVSYYFYSVEYNLRIVYMKIKNKHIYFVRHSEDDYDFSLYCNIVSDEIMDDEEIAKECVTKGEKECKITICEFLSNNVPCIPTKSARK